MANYTAQVPMRIHGSKEDLRKALTWAVSELATSMEESETAKEINFADYPPKLAALLRTAVRTVDALSARITTARQKADGDEIGIEEWQTRMVAIIRRVHEQAMLIGADVDELTPEMQAEVDRLVSIQTEFLNNFLDDIEAAGGWIGDFFARARMYGTAATAAYWHGNVQQQTGGRVLPVPAYPTEGTQCLSHCKCAWKIDTLEGDGNYDAYWVVNSSETCQTCVERGQQWYPLRIRDGVLL